MSFFVNSITEFSCQLYNFSACSDSQPKKDEASYITPLCLGACLLAAYGSVYFSQACWSRRAVQLTIQDCVRDPSKIFELKKAKDGTTEVYLGSTFVIKNTGENLPIRTRGTAFARIAIQNNNFSHLVVPKTHGTIQDGKFLAEERLPIAGSLQDAMEVYETHREAFTPAVQEFARLLLRCSFSDLLDWGYNYPSPYKTPLPRFDNVAPLFGKRHRKVGISRFRAF